MDGSSGNLHGCTRLKEAEAATMCDQILPVAAQLAKPAGKPGAGVKNTTPPRLEPWPSAGARGRAVSE